MPSRPLFAAAGAAVVAAVVAGSASSQGPAEPVAVFPAAGTKVASPKTQISFRGAGEGQLTGIVVKGSVSGRHGGTLRAHSDGQGASFLPKKDFRSGEHVTVALDRPMVGERDNVVRFRIARTPGNFSLPTQKDKGGDPPGAQHFESVPHLRPPSIKILTREPEARGDGHIFVAAKAGPGQDGPIIADERGRTLWFYRLPDRRTSFDFRRQVYRGKPVLTWWQGKSRPGQGLGYGRILDSSYRQIAKVRAGNGYQADLHEFEISRRNTALILVYNPVNFGSGVSMDTIVQEIDIPTGLVMYEWHTLGMLSRSESYEKREGDNPYDLAHLNSIQLQPDGHFLVSARHTNAIYKLDGRTAGVRWRLGGKRSDFRMGKNTRVISQHDARLQPDGSITLYDNGGPPKPGKESRGLWLNVNEAERTVSVRRDIRYRRKLKAFSQGNMQVLPDGSVFVGWGGNVPWFSQHAPDGRIIFDAQFRPKSDDTDRAYRFPWVGRPARPPDVVANSDDGRTTVHVSWNGSTGVARWEVLGGQSAGALKPLASKGRFGFETRINFAGTPRFVAARARAANGAVLGTSDEVRPR